MRPFSQDGSLYPAGSAGCEPVRVTFLSDSAMTVRAAAGTGAETGTGANAGAETRYEFKTLRVEDKLASLPREVTLPDGGLLSLPSSTRVDAWLDRKAVRNWLFALEGKAGIAVASVVLVPALLFVLFRYAMPAMAIRFAEWVPESYVELASQQTLKALDRTLLEPSEIEEREQAAYLAHWRGTLDALGLDAGRYDIGFRSAEPLGPNAFALPDGTIIFTDQLVAMADGDADILQAILLHEIGHVEQRHAMRGIAQSIATIVMVSYLFGDLSGIAEILIGGGAAVIDLKFSQSLEWEADDYALQHLAKVPGGQESFAQAIEKLAATIGPNESPAAKWLSSHPSLQARIANARRRNP